CSHKVHAFQTETGGAHLKGTTFNRDRGWEFGARMVLAIQKHISAVIPVEEIHTHRISSWLTIIGFQRCIEQCASQHLPPPKRLQLVPITGLNFRFLPAPKTGVLVMT